MEGRICGGRFFLWLFVETSCSSGLRRFVGGIEAEDDARVCIVEVGFSKQGVYNILPSCLSFRVGVKSDWECVPIHFSRTVSILCNLRRNK